MCGLCCLQALSLLDVLLYLTRYGHLVYYLDKIAVIDIGSKVFASGMSYEHSVPIIVKSSCDELYITRISCACGIQQVCLWFGYAYPYLLPTPSLVSTAAARK